MEEPLLSICIPTYNRADLLDYCLEGVREFERFDVPFEVVVSDNASEDHTQEVLRRRREEMGYLKVLRHENTVPANVNLFNAFRHASAPFVTYLADDDSLIAKAVLEYVRKLDANTDLAAVYADWIAYDDAQSGEIHRYFHFPEPACFAPDNPIGLIDFVLKHAVLPEIGIYRRDALLRSACFIARTTYTHLHWMYRLSRTGKIAFELGPFYREHRVLKPQFQRTAWGHMLVSHQMIGDELRNVLECIVLWALQDAGHSQLPENQAGAVRQMIDNFLNARIPLEIRRAIAAQNWLLAAELRRRLVLWHGPGTPEQQKQDVMTIVLPAALQATALACRRLGPTAGLALAGFRTSQAHDFIGQHFPDIRLLEAAEYDLPQRPPEDALVLFRDRAVSERRFELTPAPSHSLRLDELLETYRINTAKVELDAL